MNLEFSSNICLRKERDLTRFQFVYATQLYGTLFGVYAKFECDPIINHTRRVRKIHFIGLNYKGCKTLRIVPKTPDSKEIFITKDPFWNHGATRGLQIEFWVQATSEPLKTSLKDSILFLNMDQFDEDFVVFHGDYLNLRRRLLPMNVDESMRVDFSLPIHERAFVNGHFDSEFYVRDGLFAKEKSDNGDEIKFSNQHLFVEDNIASNPISPEIAWKDDGAIVSIKCTPSDLQFVL